MFRLRSRGKRESWYDYASFNLPFKFISTTKQSRSHRHPSLRSKQLKRKILGNNVIVFEDDAEIELEVDLEVSCLQRWTREQSREGHVDGNVNLRADISVGDLKVLDFSRVFAVALGAAAGFDAHQLDLDALDGDLRVVDGDEAVERLGETANRRVEGPGDEKPRD